MHNRASHTQHTVLVVDDERAILEVLQQLLTRAGLTVLTATNAAEVFAILENQVPCLVMADVMLPGLDGFGICRRIKADPRTADVPVVLVSGRIEEANVDEGVAAGASDYIKKPFDRDEVRMRVWTQIRLHEARIDRQRVDQHLAVISSAAKDAIVIIDDTGAITHWNQAAESMFGYTHDEAMGRHLHTMLTPERFRAAHVEAFPRFRVTGEGGAVGKTVELAATKKSGDEIPIELSLSTAKVDGSWCAVGIIRDISERKLLESELGHARKLEAVGQLAAGIAHEINTPAQYVGDSVQFLQEAFDGIAQVLAQRQRAVEALRATGEHDALVGEIGAVEADVDLDYLVSHVPDSFSRCLDGVGRISTIVRAMKEFAHPDSREKAPADLNQALRSTLIIAANEYKYVADVETDLADLPPVSCHLGDLNQVFLNLIVNAAHAIGDVVANSGTKGRIVVTTRRDGDAVRITIRDTGGGIPPSVRDRIYEPFFTTKEVGKGSGQGLAIARSIVVDKHGGALDFDTEMGAGTTFTITLPLDLTGPPPGGTR